MGGKPVKRWESRFSGLAAPEAGIDITHKRSRLKYGPSRQDSDLERWSRGSMPCRLSGDPELGLEDLKGKPIEEVTEKHDKTRTRLIRILKGTGE